MSIIGKSDPEPAPTGPFLPQQLTVTHPHARVAKVGFWASFRVHPGGRISAARRYVAAGQLADDRGPLVRHYPQHFRKPTEADGSDR